MGIRVWIPSTHINGRQMTNVSFPSTGRWRQDDYVASLVS